jgi:hypothetical protein
VKHHVLGDQVNQRASGLNRDAYFVAALECE